MPVLYMQHYILVNLSVVYKILTTENIIIMEDCCRKNITGSTYKVVEYYGEVMASRQHFYSFRMILKKTFKQLKRCVIFMFY